MSLRLISRRFDSLLRVGSISPFILSSLAISSAASASTFDAVTHWTGTGDKRAAIVLDWNDSQSPASVVWGYRWATGATPNAEEMLLDVVRDDPQLFAKIGTAGDFGTPIYGLGYDANPANGFAISTAGTFDANGVAVVDAGAFDAQGPVDGGVASFAGDRYAEGWWSNGYWFQYVAATDPFDGGQWRDAFGLASEPLSDGEFVGLSFAAGFNASLPTNPVPEPMAVSLLASGVVIARRRR